MRAALKHRISVIRSGKGLRLLYPGLKTLAAAAWIRAGKNLDLKKIFSLKKFLKVFWGI